MLKKDGRNLLVNTKIRSIHFVNIVMLCECTLCVVSVFFYTAFCLYVCIFFLCATKLVNKDVYITSKTLQGHRNCGNCGSYKSLTLNVRLPVVLELQ